jgi:hypothetical protein
MSYVEIQTDGMIAETRDAVLVEIDGKEKWIPKSQIEDADESYELITITSWLAEKEGLDLYIVD